MRSRIGVFAAILLVAAGLCVPAASAKAHMLIGIQDDSMTLHGNPQFTFSTMKQLRTQIVRINLNWNDVAKRRPAHAQDPADPAYDWDLYDRAIRYTAQYGMQTLLTILFTPSWANGGRCAQRPADQLHRPAQLRVRRGDALQRPLHPEHRPVRRGVPTGSEILDGLERAGQPKLAAAGIRRSLCESSLLCAHLYRDLAGRALHELRGREGRVRRDRPARQQRAAFQPAVPLSPLAFMRLTKAAGLRNLDAYAHNPYYGAPSETPATRPGGSAVTLGNMNTLIAVVNKLWGKNI